MTRTLKLCSALLLALAAASANAVNYAGTPFEIEMIVFSRTQGMDKSGETWPAAPKLQYPQRWVDFHSQKNGLPLLTQVPTQLNNKVAALNRSGNYKVLFHRAWQQVLQQKHRSPAIVISGGDSYGDHHQLEGTITVSVAHYLHLSTNLWYNEFDGTGNDNVAGSGVLVPAVPRAPLTTASASDEPMNLSAGASQSIATDMPAYARHVALLQAKRRLRSGELHYFDNPQFGVLIEIRKVDPSENAAGSDA
ncbi:peptidoglycan binding protein CsiV [Microbulbifer sp. SAOS-129_SWC]|uniref:peptidoglycan binding protein CsiV n=1 Tax=Microbulbifer sp. SAOS-129_SWC TaxID=3145235 RepID=UPI003217BE42